MIKLYDLLTEILADIPNFATRIDAGKKLERKVIDQLQARGLNIQEPTSSEDKYDKIDGWLIDKVNNKKYAIQVKVRESGNDIIFELMTDLDRNILGRDLKGSAQLYIFANKSGVTRMYMEKDIKEKAQKLLDYIENDLNKNTSKSFWQGDKWQVRLQTDRAHGQKKLMAYFDPSLFTSHATWNLSI